MNLANWDIGDIFMFIFAMILMFNNIEALIQYRKVQEAMKDIEEEDLEFRSKLQMFTTLSVAAFILKWLIYIIAYVFIGHFLILIVGGILFLLRFYLIFKKVDHSESKVIDFVTLVGETLFVAYFIIHYFIFIL